MSMMTATGKRKAKARKRDTKYMRDVAKAMKRCMGIKGIWELMRPHGAAGFLPTPAEPKRAPRSIHCGSPERIGFPHRDTRWPGHVQHEDLHHDGATCDCTGRGSSRKALAPA